LSVSADLLRADDGDASEMLQISIAKIDLNDLSAELKEKLGENPIVLDFNLSIGGKAIQSFQHRELEVSIPYTPGQGEAPGKIVIYYIGDNGQLEIVKNGKYNPETGMVEFRPKHF